MKLSEIEQQEQADDRPTLAMQWVGARFGTGNMTGSRRVLREGFDASGCIDAPELIPTGNVLWAGIWRSQLYVMEDGGAVPARHPDGSMMYARRLSAIPAVAPRELVRRVAVEV